MNEEFAKKVFLFAAGFAAGCASTAFGFALMSYRKAENEGLAMNMSRVIAFTDNPVTNAETAKSVMKQTLLPTLLAAMQAGWSPEVFENNIKTQFNMTSTIMISLYQKGLEEDLTFEQFKEKINSEIDFIIISAENQE